MRQFSSEFGTNVETTITISAAVPTLTLQDTTTGEDNWVISADANDLIFTREGVEEMRFDTLTDTLQLVSQLSVSKPNSGAAVDILVNNESNIAGSLSRLRARIAGSSADSALLELGIVGGQTWLTLLDATDNRYKIISSGTTTATGAIEIDTTDNVRIPLGNLGVGGSESTAAPLIVKNGSITGADQQSVVAITIAQSDATNSFSAFSAGSTTAAAVFTCPLFTAYKANNAAKGAGSTITRHIMFFGSTPTQGTNNATIADNSTFTGNYFINSTNINPSVFSGYLEVGNQADPGASVNAIRVGSIDTVAEATATLALRTEQVVEAIGTFTPSNKLKININGTEYWIQLDAV